MILAYHPVFTFQCDLLIGKSCPHLCTAARANSYWLKRSLEVAVILDLESFTVCGTKKKINYAFMFCVPQ